MAKVDPDYVPRDGLHVVAKKRPFKLRDPRDGRMKLVSRSKPRLFKYVFDVQPKGKILTPKQAQKKLDALGSGDVSEGVLREGRALLARVTTGKQHCIDCGETELAQRLDLLTDEFDWFFDQPAKDCVSLLYGDARRVLALVDAQRS